MTQEISSDFSHAAASTTNAASNALHRAGEQAAAFAKRGTDAMHHSADVLQRRSGELQSRARHYTHETSAYIQREPAKSMLMAAAAGAALMALVSLLSRSRNAP